MLPSPRTPGAVPGGSNATWPPLWQTPRPSPPSPWWFVVGGRGQCGVGSGGPRHGRSAVEVFRCGRAILPPRCPWPFRAGVVLSSTGTGDVRPPAMRLAVTYAREPIFHAAGFKVCFSVCIVPTSPACSPCNCLVHGGAVMSTPGSCHRRHRGRLTSAQITVLPVIPGNRRYSLASRLQHSSHLVSRLAD